MDSERRGEEATEAMEGAELSASADEDASCRFVDGGRADLSEVDAIAVLHRSAVIVLNAPWLRAAAAVAVSAVRDAAMLVWRAEDEAAAAAARALLIVLLCV